jgi:hypothetical protein|tara:strand:+ start:417 stop:560 length:144 start_codon:yes stop_codon:yes gene_type:complete
MARIIKKGNKYLVPVRVTYPRRTIKNRIFNSKKDAENFIKERKRRKK